MIEHVYEKVMNGGSEAGSGAGTPTGERGHGADGEEGTSMAEAQVNPVTGVEVWLVSAMTLSAIGIPNVSHASGGATMQWLSAWP